MCMFSISGFQIRRWTGVPKQFLVPAKVNAPGAMVDYDGQAVVPKIDQ